MQAQAEIEADRKQAQQQLVDAGREVRRLQAALMSSSGDSQQAQQLASQLALADSHKEEARRFTEALKQKDEQLSHYKNSEKMIRAKKGEDEKALKELQMQHAAAEAS